MTIKRSSIKISSIKRSSLRQHAVQLVLLSFLIGGTNKAQGFPDTDRSNLVDCPQRLGSYRYGCHLRGKFELGPSQPRHMVASVRYDFSCHSKNADARTMQFGVIAKDSGHTALFDYGRTGEVEVEGFGPFFAYDGDSEVNAHVANENGCSLKANLVALRLSPAGYTALENETESLIEEWSYLATLGDLLAAEILPATFTALKYDVAKKIAIRLALATRREARSHSSSSAANVSHERRANAEERDFLSGLLAALQKGLPSSGACDDGAEDLCLGAVEKIKASIDIRTAALRARMSSLRDEVARLGAQLAAAKAGDKARLNDLMATLTQALLENDPR